MEWRWAYKIRAHLKQLFKFDSYEDEIEHETLMLSSCFLSEVQKVLDIKKMSKKELAGKIGTSASYVTQLFRGNKIINLNTIARIQKELDINFNIGLNEGSEYPMDVSEWNIADFLENLHENSNGEYFKLIKNKQTELLPEIEKKEKSIDFNLVA